MIMMDFMYGSTGRSCMKSNSDSLNISVDKSFYDSRGFFAVFLPAASTSFGYVASFATRPTNRS